MGFLDLILNVTAVLLWTNWRMGVGASRVKHRVQDLGYSSRGPSIKAHSHSWHSLLGLITLLVARPFLYWEIGSATGWVATLKLGAVSIPFRSEQLAAMQIFSWASFLQLLLYFYFCLIFLGIFNKGNNANENNFIHRGIQRMVGKLDGLPALFRMCIPGVVSAPLWFLLCGILEWTQIMPAQESWKAVFHESLVVGLCAYLPWCHIMAVLIFICFIHGYIYLGSSPVWNYLQAITRRTLHYLYLLPLQINKIDFTPVAGMAIVFLIYENGIRLLTALFAMAMR